MIRFLKSARGILGLNARNLDYQRPMNSKSAKRIADNKLVAKKCLNKRALRFQKHMPSLHQ